MQNQVTANDIEINIVEEKNELVFTARLRITACQTIEKESFEKFSLTGNVKDAITANLNKIIFHKIYGSVLNELNSAKGHVLQNQTRAALESIEKIEKSISPS